MLATLLSLRTLTTTLVSSSLLVLPVFASTSESSRLPHSFMAQAQPASPETAIDRAFRSGSLPPGTSTQLQSLLADLRNWMGPYQGLRREGNGYIATFERGELPVAVRQDARGQINSVSFGCPRSRSLNLSQASKELRRVFSRCLGPRS